MVSSLIKITKKSIYLLLFCILLYLLSRYIIVGFGANSSYTPPKLYANLLGVWNFRFSILLFAVFLSFFICSKISFWLFVFPICVLSALYSPIASVYGAPDYQAFISFLATDFSEATEFLSLVPFKEYKRSFLILMLAFLSYFLARKLSIKPWRNKTYVLIAVALLILAVEPTQFIRKITDANKEAQAQLKELNKFATTTSWHKSYFDGAPKDYILIIGESARKDYFHSYGYPVSNTPFLDRNYSVMVDGMKAGGTYTIGSLTNMLTLPDKIKWQPKYDRTLIDLAKSAGIRTYWISSQGMVGKWDTPVSAIGKKADVVVFLNKGDYSTKNISDYALLKPFRRALKNPTTQSRLIVLHTIGSHPDACNRTIDFKNSYRVKDKNYEYLACYVSSIKKTDDFIGRVYEILRREEKRTGRPFSIIYFSDHGQVHRVDNGKILLNNNVTSKFHYDIPLIKIDSDSKGSVILSSEKSGLNFTEGLANWMGIRNSDIPSYDLFDGKSDPQDFGLKAKIESIKTPMDRAIDLSPYID